MVAEVFRSCTKVNLAIPQFKNISHNKSTPSINLAIHEYYKPKAKAFKSESTHYAPECTITPLDSKLLDYWIIITDALMCKQHFNVKASLGEAMNYNMLNYN